MEDNLGIKIGSKEQAAWKNIYEKTLVSIESYKRELELNEVILNYSKKRMEEEEIKFNAETKEIEQPSNSLN